MKKNLFFTLLFSVILSLVIITFSYFYNYFKSDENKYILHTDEITSITHVVGKRNLKYKKVSSFLKKQNIKKTYAYDNIDDVYSDLSKYVNYLREKENFLVTKSFDLNNKEGEIELAKYSSDKNYIVMIDIKYDKNDYLITATRSKGSINSY